MGGSHLHVMGFRYLCLIGHIFYGNGLFRILFSQQFSFEYNILCITLHHSCSNTLHLFLQLHAGLLYRFAGNISSRRGVGTRIVGRNIGIGAKYSHVIHITFHPFCNHLRQNRVASRSHVGSTNGQIVCAIIRQG